MLLTHLQVSTAVALIAGYFAAHAAGFLTDKHAPTWVLGGVTAFLAALAGVLPTVAWNEHQNWKVYLANVFVALIATTLGHKSQIPSALHRGTPGIPLTRRTVA